MMRTSVLVAFILTTLLAQPILSDESFKDVPKDHWAADSVQMIAADGVMKGYPDATFKGDKSVTRYELAVALGNMIEFIEQSLEKEVKSQKLKVESQGAPSPLLRQAQDAEAVAPPKPAVSNGDPAQKLKDGGYIAANSPLLTNRDKAVSPTELAQALASVAEKLIKKTILPPKD